MTNNGDNTFILQIIFLLIIHNLSFQSAIYDVENNAIDRVAMERVVSSQSMSKYTMRYDSINISLLMM